MKKTYTMTVQDQTGVLNRITGCLRRSGLNIHSGSIEPLGEGRTRISLQIELNAMQAANFEKKLKDWSFVFSTEEKEDAPE